MWGMNPSLLREKLWVLGSLLIVNPHVGVASGVYDKIVSQPFKQVSVVCGVIFLVFVFFLFASQREGLTPLDFRVFFFFFSEEIVPCVVCCS